MVALGYLPQVTQAYDKKKDSGDHYINYVTQMCYNRYVDEHRSFYKTRVPGKGKMINIDILSRINSREDNSSLGNASFPKGLYYTDHHDKLHREDLLDKISFESKDFFKFKSDKHKKIYQCLIDNYVLSEMKDKERPTLKEISKVANVSTGNIFTLLHNKSMKKFFEKILTEEGIELR